MTERYLVTGAVGFVGSEIVRLLVRNGHNVRALVRTLDSRSDELKQLAPDTGKVEVVAGDISKLDSILPAFEGVTGVYNIAALFRKAGCGDQAFFDTNVTGAQNVCEASVKNGVRRLIHCSTVGVHGHIEAPPAKEDAPFAPGDPYQVSKLEGEKAVRSYFERGLLNGAIIRPAMVYGPGDLRTLKLFSMIARKFFFYVGDGKGLVHFIDVRDLAQSFLLAMNHTEVNNEAFIIAGEQPLPLDAVVALIARELQVDAKFPHVPVALMHKLAWMCETVCKPFGIEPPLFKRRVDFYTKHRSFCSVKAKALLGFEPMQAIEEEISDIVADYRARKWIPAAKEVKRTSFRRSLSGTIHDWTEPSERFYGWQASEATGSTSHELLRTRFPAPLPDINNSLQRHGFWGGELLHTRRDGSLIKVRSTWKIEKGTENVWETNHEAPTQGVLGKLSVATRVAVPGGCTVLSDPAICSFI